MRFWTAYVFIALGAAKAWGAGHGAATHHGSATDLIAPFVNVAILVGFLVWKLRGPIHKMFVDKSAEVSNTLERASLKSQEAKILLEGEERKRANLTTEIQTINTQAEQDVTNFEKRLSKETEEKTHKLKTDASMKIQADKKAMIDALNAELLEQVVSKAKSTIKNNKDMQTKVSDKLLQGL